MNITNAKIKKKTLRGRFFKPQADRASLKDISYFEINFGGSVNFSNKVQ